MISCKKMGQPKSVDVGHHWWDAGGWLKSYNCFVCKGKCGQFWMAPNVTLPGQISLTATLCLFNTLTVTWSLLYWNPLCPFYSDIHLLSFILTATWSLLLCKPPGPFYPDSHLVPFTMPALWSLYYASPVICLSMTATWFLTPCQPPDPF